MGRSVVVMKSSNILTDTPRVGVRQSGMTLIELLTVLAIVAALMGVSAAVYTNVRHSHALPAAGSQVSSVIRAARNWALTAGIPSKVFIEPQDVDLESNEPGRITAFGYELVAAWHFEDVGSTDPSVESSPISLDTVLVGALNERATVHGECYPARGKIGSAIEFANDGAAIVADHRPRYHSPTGFSLEAWVQFYQPDLTESQSRSAQKNKRGVWRDPRREERYAVISKHGSYEMGVLGDGAVYVLIGDLETEEEDYFAATRGGVVQNSEWAHLRVSYDSLSVTIEIDGSERESIPIGFEMVDPADYPGKPKTVPRSDGHLSISNPSSMFLGIIDQPKVRMAVEPRVYHLPAGIYFLQEKSIIRFDTRGSLDPLYHTQPVVVRVANFPRPALRPDETTSTGMTAVVTPVNPDELQSLADPDSTEVGDPLAALAEYLKEHAEGEVKAEGTQARDAREDELQVEDAEGGQVQSVIVDLTGTIRG